MRLLPLFLLAAAFCSGSPFKALVDRPGEWEAVWQGREWTVSEAGAGTWSAREKGIPRSSHAGDLDVSRARVLLAMPSASSWRLEILEDSGQILAPRSWARVPRVDPGTGVASPAPVSTWPESSEKVTGSVRLVTLDLPLAALRPDGSLRARTRLRIRVSWTGGVRPADGTAWKNIVDNPAGILARLPVAPRRIGTALNLVAGRTLSIQVGDTAPFTAQEDGIVRLTGAQIYQVLGINGGASWPNIALYGGSGDTVSVANPGAPAAPGLKLVPYKKVDRGSDGVLDPEDEIWFWVRGTSLWKPDISIPGTWKFSIHPFSQTRRYILRLDAPSGTTMGASRVPSNPATFPIIWQPVWAGSPNLLLNGLYYESTTDPNTGTGWFWRDAQTISNLGPDQLAYPSTSSLPGLAKDSGVATLYTANATLSSTYPLQNVDFKLGSTSGRLLSYLDRTATFSVRGLASTGNQFSLSNAMGLLVSGYTVTYQKDVSKSDSAVFPAPSMGAVSIPVGTGAVNCWVLEGGVAVRTCSIVNGVLKDSATDPDTWYAVFGSNPGSKGRALAPYSAPAQTHAVKDPTSTASYDMVVVAPDEFMDIAEEYAAWRGDSKQIRPMKVGILRAQDVWDLWGSGAMDPAALRNALRWANSQWGISHALLMGSGHADPRGIRHPAQSTRIPQWEDDEVSTDDFYTWFDSTGAHIPKIALGRVPARSVAEARAWLDKVELFEDPTKADFGTWRNTIVLASDDQWQGGRPDNLGHSAQTEQIAEAMEAQHPWLHTERLFEQTYPFDNTGMKPDARRALVDLLNQGTTAFNYMGHGAPYQLTDEDLLDLPTIQRSIVNSTRPFFFFAGSCTVGRHDDPDSRGMSETFVISAGRGTFAGVGGTRPTFSSENTVLSSTLWQRMLDTTGAASTIGEALQSAKVASAYQSSTYAIQDLYNLLGDPAMILYPNTLKVKLDSIPDSLSALSKITLSGTATGAGVVHVRLDHPLPADTFSEAGTEVTVPTPQQLLGVSTQASAGKFSTSVLLPAKIPFGDSARFKAYAWDPSTRHDGGTVAPSRIMAGVGKEIPKDNIGPELRIRSCDSSWTGGVAFGKVAKIPLPFCLQVDIHDSSGISSDLGPDEGVVFSLPGLKDPWHPDLHQGVDFRSAFAQLDLDSSLVQPGVTYTFQASARDLMGNLSKGSLQIQPMTHGTYALYDVFNSPNPVRDGGGTTFYFKLSTEPDSNGSADTRIQSSIRIHTVSGKLVKVLRTELSQASQSRPRATWDLKDSFGRPVANGIYPYTVTLRLPDATGTVTTDLVKRGIVAVAR